MIVLFSSNFGVFHGVILFAIISIVFKSILLDLDIKCLVLFPIRAIIWSVEWCSGHISQRNTPLYSFPPRIFNYVDSQK